MVIENLIGGFASSEEEGGEDIAHTDTTKCPRCGNESLETTLTEKDGSLYLNSQSCSNPGCD